MERIVDVQLIEANKSYQIFEDDIFSGGGSGELLSVWPDVGTKSSPKFFRTLQKIAT